MVICPSPVSKMEGATGLEISSELFPSSYSKVVVTLLDGSIIRTFLCCLEADFSNKLHFLLDVEP